MRARARSMSCNVTMVVTAFRVAIPRGRFFPAPCGRGACASPPPRRRAAASACTCGDQLAVAHPLEQRAKLRQRAAGIAGRELPPEDADDLGAFEEHEVERDLRDLAGGEADDEVARPSTPSRATPPRRLAADRIVDDVGAVAVGERLDALFEILARVVDDVGRRRSPCSTRASPAPRRRRSRARRAACRARRRRCRRRRRRRARAASRPSARLRAIDERV